MTKYIISENFGSKVSCSLDFVIFSGNVPLFLSIVDVPSRVRKVCNDFISYTSSPKVELRDRDDLKYKNILYVNGNKFRFRFSPNGNGLLHAIIINVSQEQFFIDWDFVGRTKIATNYLRNECFIPVSENIVENMVSLQDKDRYHSYDWIKELTVETNNPEYQNIHAYAISIEYFKRALQNVRTQEYTSDFNWDAIDDTTDYIFSFLNPIKQTLYKNVTPLYNPESINKYMFDGKFKPYDGQIPVIQSAIEILKRDKAVYINADQGFGKTPATIKTLYSYCKEKGKNNYNVLVVAPAITISQWNQEILDNQPDKVNVEIITSGVDFISKYNSNPEIPTFYLVGKETFKLDSKIAPAVNFSVKNIRRKKLEKMNSWSNYKYEKYVEETFTVATCPNCGLPLKNENRVTEDVYLDRSDFDKPKKSNMRCYSCNSILWQSVYEKTKKTSVINYIKTKNIKFDFVIADEIHESNNAESIIGTSIRTLLANHAKKVILLSGTSNNGYASSLHNVLMALFSRKLLNDGCLKVEDFVKKYGSMMAVTKVKDGEYRRSGRNYVSENDWIETEGINPVVFTKYLAENFIFATLDDLGKDLPNLHEYYVPILADEEIEKNANWLASEFKEANSWNYKKYEDTIVKHYLNNPYGWCNIEVVSGENTSIIKPKNMTDYVSEKESKLIEICKQEKKDGRKTWVYCEFSGDTSKYMAGEGILSRLKRLLEYQGLMVFVLKASVKNIDRKEMIDKNIDDYDVFISNPLLINVGINLQAIPNYIFYIPSYRVNVVRQSARRGYRANSTMDNHIYYMYYSNTIENDIIKRQQRKYAEASAIEAKFNISIEDEKIRTSSAFGKKIDLNLDRNDEV